jgi:hypothetical protein
VKAVLSVLRYKKTGILNKVGLVIGSGAAFGIILVGNFQAENKVYKKKMP